MTTLRESGSEVIGIGRGCHNQVMSLQKHNPAELFPPYTNYAHAVEVAAGSRLLFVSGLNGYTPMV